MNQSPNFEKNQLYEDLVRNLSTPAASPIIGEQAVDEENGAVVGPVMTGAALAEQLPEDDDAAQFALPEHRERLAILQAILFASAAPVKVADFQEACPWPTALIKNDLEDLAADLQGSGLELQRIAGAWCLMTAARTAVWVERFLKLQSRKRLTKAQLETLAVIAYRQPVTRAEIEAYRGVRAERILKQLEDLNLIRETGRAPVPGRPVQFGTTADFLRYFALNRLEDLPEVSSGSNVLKKIKPVEGSAVVENKSAVGKVAADVSDEVFDEEALVTDEEGRTLPVNQPSPQLLKIFERIKKSRASEEEGS